MDSELQSRRDKDGRLVANAIQYEAVKVVVDRVNMEIEYNNGSRPDAGDPLRWVLHGGPGTGKSHVIKRIQEFFREVLKYEIGVHFQVVALQAVMAALLGGDTIHHALGIPCFGRRTSSDGVDNTMTVAKRVLRWRWLIVEEISMVSAKLLASIDQKLRSVVRAYDTQKHQGGGLANVFGGLNALFSGDFGSFHPWVGATSVTSRLCSSGRRDNSIQPSPLRTAKPCCGPRMGTE